MRKISNFFYLLSQGFIGVFRNSVMSTASVLVLVCCMLIIGTFGLVAEGVNDGLSKIDDLNVIAAYLNDDLTEEQITAIHTQLDSLENVSEVRYVSKEEAMEQMKAEMQDDQILIDYLNTGINPLPNAFNITFTNVDKAQQLLNTLEKIEGIDRTNDKIRLVESASTITSGLMIIAAILMGVLLIVSLFVIMNTIKLGVFARRSEITIMRYVGATNSFIVTPFIVEGVLIGIFAAILSTGLQYLLYAYVISDIGARYSLALPAFGNYAGLVFLAFLAIGLFAGVVASSLSIKKYLKA